MAISNMIPLSQTVAAKTLSRHTLKKIAGILLERNSLAITKATSRLYLVDESHGDWQAEVKKSTIETRGRPAKTAESEESEKENGNV